jgi:hypothetical protein
MGANDHVDMTGHYAIAIYFKSLVLLAVLPAGNHYILVFVTDKQIDSVSNSKAYKIKLVLVVKFILRAHGLKIHYQMLSSKNAGIFIACFSGHGGYLAAEHESPLRFWPARQTLGGLLRSERF